MVCHLAVWPGVEVSITAADGAAGVAVHLRNFDRTWHWSPGLLPQACPDPLIAACLDDAGLPAGAWRLDVGSRVPPGASMGTSASVCVAVLAVLDALRQRHSGATTRDDAVTVPSALARRAHAIETVRLQQESGVQDQWAAASGGVNLLTIKRYPQAHCEALRLDQRTRAALASQLLVVLLSRRHDSSAVHRLVVQQLRDGGPDDPRLESLRGCARDGAAALRAGDLEGYGALLTRNTEAQAALHPSLVNEEARAIMAAVAGADVLGVKVNGAGGAGGSLTVLAASADARARLVARLAAIAPGARPLEVQLAGGPVTRRAWSRKREGR